MTDEQKKKKSKYDREYMKSHYRIVGIQTSPEEKERWKAAAKAAGKSLQAYVKDAVEKCIATAES